MARQSDSSVTLILGGARSGKSRHGEGLVAALPSPWVYIATAEAWDNEMKARIAEHRARRDERWHTVDAPLALPQALRDAGDAPVLVDCLTLWLTNLMLADRDVPVATEDLLAALAGRRAPTVLVANEVGLGIVPDHRLGRDFRDAAGILHQRVAAQAAHVLFMVAGLPMVVK
ncbi:bifunctional adenosylcobinamide kinase/adenosylcobinamide-phosphate guanylyltransferase [Acidisoma cellulosilytica]|uniref:Bifunctional adenosylcobalamin biosynthesis protein n=1 Tax=Acidisoma cellulosilyticum TaxID=2802395 RepID=A0A963YZ14_9PROT|nr:bifunctional adenosylcobinamide kinase/adenosylcobinamide-phosphate guanylyltransferase [Acidisoma cellulosilyticum]MCB8879817.1 bifunctional adenosylcobinamide kinase/adenosylcobinamide-phosphate guanylyltransferase [Acidisoma cellulosilyticum]